MRENEWWTGTARHMWRAYFAMTRNSTINRSATSIKIYTACNGVFLSLAEQEQSILRAYYDRQHTPGIDGFPQVAKKCSVRVEIVAATIRSANKQAVIKVGLLETEN